MARLSYRSAWSQGHGHLRYNDDMDAVWAIRALIFFTAGFALVLFTKPVVKAQFAVVGFMVDGLHIGFMRRLLIDKERVARSDRIAGVCFLVISMLLLIYSVQ